MKWVRVCKGVSLISPTMIRGGKLAPKPMGRFVICTQEWGGVFILHENGGECNISKI